MKLYFKIGESVLKIDSDCVPRLGDTFTFKTVRYIVHEIAWEILEDELIAVVRTKDTECTYGESLQY
ncbi:MAG: hypothetical protein ACREOZ_02140 [Gloeomargaritales cyanobacterium]